MSAYEPRIRLRPYQQLLSDGIYAAWAKPDVKNVLAVSPTGSGKTVLISHIVSNHPGACCLFVHRKELVGQLAATLNKYKIPFRLICDPKDRKAIIAAILRRDGVCYHDTNAKSSVASVDTLWRIPHGKQAAQYANYFRSVTLWICDEANHPQGGGTEDQKANKWGRAMGIFEHPDVKGLGVTATPARSDGGGLSRDSDGCFDEMVLGPTLAELFEEGYLCPYDIYSVPCKVEYESIAVGASGEFVHAKLVAAEEDSDLVGDIIDQYKRYAWGKKGICFVSSVAKAEETAKRFRDIGVPATALSAETDPAIRESTTRDLETGKIQMIVNCSLFTEGNDIAELEVVILGTGTASLPRYMQMVGRLYRLLLTPQEYAGYDDLDAAGRKARIAGSRKPRGILIDHGSNVVRFNGPPEAPHRVWTLGRPGRKSNAAEGIPYRVCANPGLVLANPSGHTWDSFRKAGWNNEQMLLAGHLLDQGIPCANPYEKVFRACPHCGFQPEVLLRTDPIHVDGDLELLTPETLESLYASVRQATQTVEQYEQYMASTRVNALAYGANVKRHKERLVALDQLRHVMAYWGGWRKQKGDTDSMMQRRFALEFKVDVISAQALKRAEAEDLTARITAKLLLDGIGIAEYSQGSPTEDSPQ